MILTENGVLKLMQRIKSFIASQLNTKAASVHTHNASEITDLPNANGYSKSESDSLFVNRGGGVITATSYKRDRDDSYINVYAGSDWGKGAYISLMGYNQSNEGGTVALNACSTSGAYKTLWLKPDGTATWDGKNLAMQEDVIPRSGGAVIIPNTIFGCVNNFGYLRIYGGVDGDSGASFQVNGKDTSGNKGHVFITANNGTRRNFIEIRPDGDTILGNCLIFYPGYDNTTYLGAANYRWKTVYSATSTINTSDSRLKNTITDIDDSLLDAWETIQPKQYKFNDASEKKGDLARFHTGYIAQDIQKACTDNNLDISKYGLFCYDSWEEEPEISEDVEVEKDGIKTTEKHIIRPKQEKGDSYSLRYEEALVVECAYLRREINKLKEELKQLKTK